MSQGCMNSNQINRVRSSTVLLYVLNTCTAMQVQGRQSLWSACFDPSTTREIRKAWVDLVLGSILGGSAKSSFTDQNHGRLEVYRVRYYFFIHQNRSICGRTGGCKNMWSRYLIMPSLTSSGFHYITEQCVKVRRQIVTSTISFSGT